MLARCLGRSSVANEKNASTPPLDTRNIGFKSPAEIGNYTRIVPFPQTVNSPQDKIARSLLLVVNYATTERAVYFVFLNSAKTKDAYAYFLNQPLGPVWAMWDPRQHGQYAILTLPGNGAIWHTGTQVLRSTPTVDQNTDVPQETEHER